MAPTTKKIVRSVALIARGGRKGGERVIILITFPYLL